MELVRVQKPVRKARVTRRGRVWPEGVAVGKAGDRLVVAKDK